MNLFNADKFKPSSKAAPNFHFKLEELIPWGESEMIQDEISLDNVVAMAGIFGFSKERVERLSKAKKYNKR